MPRFFVDDTSGDRIIITGETARHISKSLRMTVGEELVLCSGNGYDCGCVIDEVFAESVAVSVISREISRSEPDIDLTLYQCLPKGDKMELIIQKCVELGVKRIVPVISGRCISRPDDKAMAKKILRWNKIALEAAQQSERGIIPQVSDVMGFDQALGQMSEDTLAILFYEKGGAELDKLLTGINSGTEKRTVSMMIGPEGGFDEKEAELAHLEGIMTATLGPRILRTETAGMTAAAVIMYATGNMR